jgi:hypothetical protein
LCDLPSRRVGAIAAVLAVLFLLAVVVQMSSKSKRNTEVLAQYLLHKNMQFGYASYWSSYSTIYAAEGRILIAPVTPYSTTAYAPLHMLNKTDWYHRHANFIIWDTREPESLSGMNAQRPCTAF